MYEAYLMMVEYDVDARTICRFKVQNVQALAEVGDECSCGVTDVPALAW